MRYKNNVLDKLTHIEATANKIQLQVNRNMDQDQILESVDLLKEQIEKIRDIVSLEGDNFEQQFANR
jgi:DNA-binding transcriptional regulator YiaG